jgi:DNA uptake protein ComE-like DNA-binding protein
VRRIPILTVLSLAAACIPAAAAANPSARSQGAHAIPDAERLDLNHATVDELLKLPGMTRVWAERILRFRPYRTRLDLLQQGIVPAGVYNRIKDAVIVHREKK